jgi:hypothetical protein
VDIGAYESQSPGSVLSYAWLQQYGLPADGSADHADPDADGSDNYHEWRARTSPLNPSSVLRIIRVAPATNGATISWLSVPGVSYWLERSTNLAQPFSIVTWYDNQTNVATFTDLDATGNGPFFYRVRLP